MYSIQQRRRTSRWMMPPCSGRCPSFCIVVDKMERTSAKKTLQVARRHLQSGENASTFATCWKNQIYPKYQFLQTVQAKNKKDKIKQAETTWIKGYQGQTCVLLAPVSFASHLHDTGFFPQVCARCSLQGAHWQNPIWTGHTVSIFWILVCLDASDV